MTQNDRPPAHWPGLGKVPAHRFDEQNKRIGCLFGAHPRSVAVAGGVDLMTAGITDEIEAESRREPGR